MQFLLLLFSILIFVLDMERSLQVLFLPYSVDRARLITQPHLLIHTYNCRYYTHFHTPAQVKVSSCRMIFYVRTPAAPGTLICHLRYLCVSVSVSHRKHQKRVHKQSSNHFTPGASAQYVKMY